MDDSTPEGTVVGLDVRGQLFYFPLSTLLAANDGCSYFSARFCPDSFDPGLLRVDEQGRNIYGLDRDPYLFKHVAEFLETSKRPRGIGWFADNKILWEGVREEAQYLALDALAIMLTIAFSCSPEEDRTKGVLYWLGTKKGAADYMNPHERRAVEISGWFEEEIHQFDLDDGAKIEYDKATFVQYRPNEAGERLTQRVRPINTRYQGRADNVTYDQLMNGDDDMAEAELRGIFHHHKDLTMGVLDICDASLYTYERADDNYPLVLTFSNGIKVSPTHYSLRSGDCFGMAGDWDFSGSVDGVNWIVLHKARGKNPLFRGIDHTESFELREYVRRFDGLEARKEAVCNYLEENQRHTWKLDSTIGAFFTHFRFTSVAVTPCRERQEFCLHGIGFELWGYVCEEQCRR